MANVTAAGRAKFFLGEVIDLTLSDSESVSPHRRLLSIRPVSEKSSSEGSDANLPDHGLLLGRDFGSSHRWDSTRTDLISLGLLKGGSSQLRRRVVSKPSVISKESGRIPCSQPSQANHANPAKRRRIELEPSPRHRVWESRNSIEESLKIDGVGGELTGNTSLPNSESVLLPALRTPQQGEGSDGKSKDAINESLRIALRQQVFPHINQCLGHYRLSIDNATRKQLGKRAAWEICGEDFMENLTRNNGRLSLTFEKKVAAIARSLIDQYAVASINDPKGQSCHNGAKDKALHTEEQKTNHPRQGESSRVILANRAETAKANKKAKLSAAMKGRWDRGEMDPVLARRVSRNAQKVGRSLSSAAARNQELPPSQRPATQPVSLDSLISSDDARLFASKLHCKEPWHQHSKPNMSSGAYTSNKRPTLGLEENPVRRQTRSSITKEVPTSAIVMHHVSSARKARGSHSRRISRAQNRQEEDIFANSHESLHQIENLRLAGLDEHASRPYLSWEHRRDVERGLAMIQSGQGPYRKASQTELSALHGSILHVGFCQEEIEYLVPAIEAATSFATPLDGRDSKEHIVNLMKGRKNIIHELVRALSCKGQTPACRLIRSRTDTDMAAFLQDAAAGTLSPQLEIKRVQLHPLSLDPVTSLGKLKTILQEREIWGRRRNLGVCRSVKARLVNIICDGLMHEAEWTDCAGDIATISWIDSDRFFCGATAHSDEHNMQYNKPGNLLVGSAGEKTLKSVPGHQIVRPIVAKGDNSLTSMRNTQDPWLYCSVTSTAYNHDNKICFTGSYDQTVKVWSVAEDGSSMSLCGTWNHLGNVNFVVASTKHCLVATGADVREDAVRVYHLDHGNISASSYDIYEASVQRRNSNDTWAYFPATMQWGISPSASHLLLVGYSPRSFNCQDAEIPDDRLNTGELCLWNSRDGSRVPIISARTQNVFEVAWHPSQPIFAAATSPTGAFEDWVKTQLRIFEQKACGSFCHAKTLDCQALDINEITIMPNSIVHCYVTASCTDGNTYVWDSALSDKPIHILRHGDSIDEQTNGATREETDSGVKFATWGKNLERFYTGSSDGVVKEWNIRATPGQEFVRDLIKFSGGVSTGKFSPDFEKLVLGDSTGKVHLLNIGSREERHPTSRRPIEPHPPLPAPLIDDDDLEIPPEQTAHERAQQFLDQGQITIHGDEYVGAIQGPNYASTRLFYNLDKYKDENGKNAIGWSIQELQEKQQQRYNIDKIRLPCFPNMESSSWLLHQKNIDIDLDLSSLSSETLVELRKEQVDFSFQDENDFQFELSLGLEEGLIAQEELLDSSEIQELQILEEQICQELRIQKGLNDLFQSSK